MFKLFKFSVLSIYVIICTMFIIHCSINIAKCQIPQTLTMEIEAKNGSGNYNIIPLAEKGLIVFNENIDKSSNSREWIVTKYDTVFKESWSKVINIHRNRSLRYVKSYYDSYQNKFHILLLRTKTYLISNRSVKNGEFVIITLNMSSGDYKITNGYLPGRTDVTEFRVLKNNAYIGGNSCPSNGTVYLHSLLSITFIPMFTGLSLFKFKPVMLNVNLTNGNLSLMPNNYSGNAYMLNEQISQQSTYDSPKYTITSINKNIINTKKSFLCFNTYDYENNIIKSDKIIMPPDSTIVSVKSFYIKENNFLSGTYKIIRRHRITFSPFYHSASELSLSADGLFFSKIINNKPDFIKFYSFRKFQNFYNVINAQGKKKINYKGKNLNTDYQLLLHDIIQRGDEYILVAEAYYPEYHLEYFWTSDAYGHFFQESREVFDGYRYTHAIITAFDTKGNLLWDNSFEIGNILTYNIKERVKTMFDEDDIVLAYSNEGRIASKIIHKNKVIQDKEEEKLDLSQSPTDFKNNLSSDIDFWYKNYFITFGYKSISNNTSKLKNAKNLFYFSKIAFQ